MVANAFLTTFACSNSYKANPLMQCESTQEDFRFHTHVYSSRVQCIWKV